MASSSLSPFPRGFPLLFLKPLIFEEVSERGSGDLPFWHSFCDSFTDTLSRSPPPFLIDCRRLLCLFEAARHIPLAAKALRVCFDRIGLSSMSLSTVRLH